MRYERIAHELGAEWFVLPKSKPVVEVLAPFGGLQGLGSQWIRRGWVVQGSDGTSTSRKRLNGSQQRVIVISHNLMENGG